MWTTEKIYEACSEYMNKFEKDKKKHLQTGIYISDIEDAFLAGIHYILNNTQKEYENRIY